jgi:hypothetical protein
MKKHERKIITGRPAMWDEIRRAKELRKHNKLSYREIAKLMSSELGKPVYVPSVFRWVNYPLSK